MRDYEKETIKRVAFIQEKLEESNTTGIVFGNSGGKDAALVGILCKKACDNTVGIMMPCGTVVNYGSDKKDAEILAEFYNIENRMLDLTKTAEAITSALDDTTNLTKSAKINITPRLRMTALYAVAASENRLVAGTGNRSERHMGYFTKWGDGAFDFNPIADLTVHEIREFLYYLDAPTQIITKSPSAGLYEGQTDEEDMGISYKAIDNYLLNGECSSEELAIIERYHSISSHKREMPAVFKR